LNDTKGVEKKIRLTQYTQGMGCACKLRPQELEKILQKVAITEDKNILVDTRNSDDAAVYRISEDKAIVQTLDFFTPVVDDAYTFGKIAASNALSDIYAMGAKPLFALNIVGFPSSRLPGSILEQILKGASDIAEKAGISIIGGHTIDDPEPKYGMVVTGIAHPNHILTNDKAKKGDALILTKPIGTGILSTAVKRGLADEETIKIVNETMSQLNKRAAEIMENYPVNACTDVTGFGLLGHLHEMTTASNVEAEISLENIPILDKTVDFASSNLIPGGTYDNLDFLKEKLNWEEGISDIHKLILCDAQTSGGLLIAVPKQFAKDLLTQLQGEVHKKSSIIGFFTEENNNIINIKKLK
jgi:selenium donor protein